MKRTQRNKILFGLLASIVLSMLFLGMMQRNLLSTLHLKISNFLYYQAENETLEDIVIVAIDDRAFEIVNASELGTLQFNKAAYAQVIENLEAAGAKVIGVDVILSEASSEEDEAALIETLGKYDNVILAAEPKTPLTTGLKPLPQFSEVHPENLGAILFEPDKDNMVRRQHLFFEDEAASQSFALRIVKKYLDLLDEDGQHIKDGYQLMPFSVRVGNKKFDPIVLPTRDDRLMINFFGAPGSFDSISFADVYENNYTERRSGRELNLQDKIVLIGEMGTGLHDEQYVPLSFGRAMSGVEIHANTIQTILSQRFLVNQSDLGKQIIVVAAILLGMLLFLTLSVGLSVFLFFVGVMAYLVTTWIVFEYGIVLNTFYPYLTFFATLVVAYLYRYFTEARALIKTEHAFGRYVNEDVVKEILENPEYLKLGGDQKTLTVFFSDIVGFTSISEKLTPRELVTRLNEYFDRMSKVILDYRGTLDKFVGDAIIAFWGAPTKQPRHAERACLAALDYMEELKKFKHKWKARIGIHTGPMIVGNVGSTKRFDYTVIGDVVNLGARLETANKFFGTNILISEETYKAARSAIEAREIDFITVKGKTKPVRVFELLAKKGKLTKGRQELIKIFAEGLKAYRAQKWAEAEKYFKAVQKLDKNDGPSKVYLKRCKGLKKMKLSKNWNGVFELTEK
ncbi:adenylate/guanylate cyclase domain-containing protein [Candidatus Peregrinibacteria bacterium]|nr:adenylate/guanylate cyclase domain-containing protein [Candidatus Peregrinibacteria bacterium]